MTTSVYLSGLVDITQYPSGESHLQISAQQLNQLVEFDTCHIIADEVRDFNGLMQCQVLDNVLKNNGINVDWIIPFFPYARDDRRNHRGEGSELELALHVGVELPAACVDPHSEVTGQLAHYTQAQVVDLYAEIGLFGPDMVIAIPDAGAAKKAYTWIPPRADVVQCLKKRDVATGKLSGFEVVGNPDLHDRRVVIVDDICDAGGTFLGLGAELKALGAASLDLAVTHGLFTKGTGTLFETFDRIFTLDCYAEDHDDLLDTVSLLDLIDRNLPV